MNSFLFKAFTIKPYSFQQGALVVHYMAYMLYNAIAFLHC